MTITILEEVEAARQTAPLDIENVQAPTLWTDAWRLGGFQPILIKIPATDPRLSEFARMAAAPSEPKGKLSLQSCPKCDEPFSISPVIGAVDFPRYLTCDCRLVLATQIAAYYARSGVNTPFEQLSDCLQKLFLDSLADLDPEESSRLFRGFLSFRKTPKSFKLFKTDEQESAAVVRFGIRETVSRTAERRFDLRPRCSRHWLTFCSMQSDYEQCSLCLQYRSAEKDGRAIKRRKVSVWPLREIPLGTRQCSSERYEPLYGTLEQYLAKFLQEPHTFITYPLRTDRARASDYVIEDSPLGKALNLIPRNPRYAGKPRLGEDIPKYWIEGDSYARIAVTIAFFFEGHFFHEHTHRLSAPKGSEFIGGKKVWRYPEGFQEPKGQDKDRSEKFRKTVLDEKRAFLRQLRAMPIEDRSVCRLHRQLTTEFPNIRFRIHEGKIQQKRPSAREWQYLNAKKLKAHISNSRFQEWAFNHLGPDDILGGGMVSAKSQTARYNFRTLENSIYPNIFGSKDKEGPTLSAIAWSAAERPELYMTPLKYWPTVGKIEAPQVHKDCNHRILGLENATRYCTVCTPKVFPISWCFEHFEGPIKGPRGCGNIKCVFGNRCKKCKELERRIKPRPLCEPGAYGFDEYALTGMGETCPPAINHKGSTCPIDTENANTSPDAPFGKRILARATKEEIDFWQRKANQALREEQSSDAQEWCPKCEGLLSLLESGEWACDECDIKTEYDKHGKLQDDPEEPESEPLEKQPQQPNRDAEVVPDEAQAEGANQDESEIDWELMEQDGAAIDLEHFEDADVSYPSATGQKHLKVGFQEKKSRRGRKSRMPWADVVRILREFYPEWHSLKGPDHNNYERRYRRLYWRYEVGLTNLDISRHERAYLAAKSTESAVEKDISNFEKEAALIIKVRVGGEFGFREVAKSLDISQSELLSLVKHGRITTTKTATEDGFKFNLKQLQVLAKNLNRVPITKMPEDQVQTKWNGTAHLLIGSGESGFSRQSVRSVGIPSTESYLCRNRVKGPSLPGPSSWLPLPIYKCFVFNHSGLARLIDSE
jgi:hypothetical protein